MGDLQLVGPGGDVDEGKAAVRLGDGGGRRQRRSGEVVQRERRGGEPPPVRAHHPATDRGSRLEHDLELRRGSGVGDVHDLRCVPGLAERKLMASGMDMDGGTERRGTRPSMVGVRGS